MKKLLACLLPLLLLLLFVGCGKKPAVEPETKPIDEGTTQTQKQTDADTGHEETVVEEEVLPVFTTIYFDFDKYNLRADAKAGLRQNAEELRNFPQLAITIAGHCDERGTIEYNLALGEKRARSAQDYLVSLGIDAARISIISYGKENPVASGHDEASWARNRRAEFIPQ